MASDEDKRLAKWKIASDTYCKSLEETIELIRSMSNPPDAEFLAQLKKKVKAANLAGSTFKLAIDDAQPPRKSPYNF